MVSKPSPDEPSVESLRRTPEGYFTVRWGQPEYTDWLDECRSWRETCYIGDWSFLWERRYSGPDVLKLFSDISVNSFDRFDVGQSRHVIHCNRDGKVIHEGILSRRDEDDYRLFGRGNFWVGYNLRHGNYKVESEALDSFNFQVSGPNSLYVIEKASGQSLRDIRFMRSGRISIDGHEVWALRQGMSGELGYELQGPAEHARIVYEKILEAGREFGIRKLGGRAAFINHLEACYPTIITDYLPAMFEPEMREYLEEFKSAMPGYAVTFSIAGSYEGKHLSDYYRSPVELGWGRNIRFDHEFLGREALEEEVANPKRTIVTLEWNADDVTDVYRSLFDEENRPHRYMEMPRDQRGFMWADKVLHGDKLVGVSTSRGYSYTFRKMLSLCTIDVDHSGPGTEVTVIWDEPGEPQKSIRARVAPAPYAPGNNRTLDVTTLPDRV